MSHAFAKEAKLREKPIKNARDVSANFFDVFRLPGDEAINPSNEVVEAAQENKAPEVETAEINAQDPIDWDLIKDQYNVYQIPAQEVEIKKNQIRGLIQTYNLSEQEFVDETVPCLHGTHKLNMHEISNTIAENYNDCILGKTFKNKLKKAKSALLRLSKVWTLMIENCYSKLMKIPHLQFLYKLKTERVEL